MDMDGNMNTGSGMDMGSMPQSAPTQTQTTNTVSGTETAPSQQMNADTNTDMNGMHLDAAQAPGQTTAADSKATQMPSQQMNTGMDMGDGMQMDAQNMSPFQMNSPLIVVDVLGIVVGLVAMFAMYRATKRLGGRAKEALMYVNIGIIAMILSFAVTLWYLTQNEMTMTSMAIHQGLMLIGMISFILAARKFFSITGA